MRKSISRVGFYLFDLLEPTKTPSPIAQSEFSRLILLFSWGRINILHRRSSQEWQSGQKGKSDNLLFKYSFLNFLSHKMGITAEPKPQGKKNYSPWGRKESCATQRLSLSLSMQEKHSRQCLIQSQTLIDALSNYSCCYFNLNCICIASTMFFLALLLIWSDLEGSRNR